MNQHQTHTIQLESQFPEKHPIDLSHLALITDYAEKYNQFSCEFTFPSLYLWSDIFHYQVSFYNNWLILIDPVNDFIFMPMGENINIAELARLSCKLSENGFSGDISKITPAILEAQPQLSVHYLIKSDRGDAEYIYLAEKLFTLSGKKLRKKKNLISQFVRQYPNYQVKEIKPKLYADCLDLVKNILATSEYVSKTLKQEYIAIQKTFESFELIPLEGIAIYTGTITGIRETTTEKNNSKDREESKLVGFAVYSRLNKEVFNIHFEKADYSHRGAAQVINWETARLLKDRCKYINREQDLGLESLRKAKLSYDPEIIYPSNFLSFRGSHGTE